MVCRLLGRWFAAGKKAVHIEIPEGVNVIGPSVFAGCENLETIKLPESLERIEDYAFAACHKLKEISFPSNLNWVSDSAFLNCTNLSSVLLPRSTANIDERTFGGCFSLKHLLVPKDFLASEDVHTSIRQFQFRKYRLVKSATDEPLKQNLILLKNSLPNVQTSNCIVFSHTTYWGCCTIR